MGGEGYATRAGSTFFTSRACLERSASYGSTACWRLSQNLGSVEVNLAGRIAVPGVTAVRVTTLAF